MENTFDYGEALNRLRKGNKVTRAGWNNPEIWLGLQIPDENSKMTEPYIFMRKYKKKFPVEISCESMLATDWKIVD